MKAEHSRLINGLIMEKLDVTESEITESASFIKDFGVDSLDVYELIMEIEKEFNLSIPDEDAENLTTVGILKKYIDEKTR
jgi:acyl carrier protein